jgi:hypothetical protein
MQVIFLEKSGANMRGKTHWVSKSYETRDKEGLETLRGMHMLACDQTSPLH